MSRLNCGGCAAFNRDEPVEPKTTANGIALIPEAQCRRTAPPWSTVKVTDWCMAWSRRRDLEHRQDDGA